jgi:hypothetical protein
MVVLCAGMFRSGSTWQYQVTVELAQRSGRPFRAHGMPHQKLVPGLVGDHAGDGVLHIIKTHTPDVIIREYLDHDGVRVLFSERDFRDVVYSMMHKLNASFEVAVRQWRVVENARINEVFWTMARNKVVQSYADWMADARPFARAIAALMDIAVDDAAVEAIVKKFCLESQKRETARVADRLRRDGVNLEDRKNTFQSDPHSLLHWNHIRQGRQGHWRDLATAEEKQVLLKLCGDWLIKRGYEKDNSWAHAGALLATGSGIHSALAASAFTYSLNAPML